MKIEHLGPDHLVMECEASEFQGGMREELRSLLYTLGDLGRFLLKEPSAALFLGLGVVMAFCTGHTWLAAVGIFAGFGLLLSAYLTHETGSLPYLRRRTVRLEIRGASLRVDGVEVESLEVGQKWLTVEGQRLWIESGYAAASLKTLREAVSQSLALRALRAAVEVVPDALRGMRAEVQRRKTDAQ